jgi:hypothetical protein
MGNLPKSQFGMAGSYVNQDSASPLEGASLWLQVIHLMCARAREVEASDNPKDFDEAFKKVARSRRDLNAPKRDD